MCLNRSLGLGCFALCVFLFIAEPAYALSYSVESAGSISLPVSIACGAILLTALVTLFTRSLSSKIIATALALLFSFVGFNAFETQSLKLVALIAYSFASVFLVLTLKPNVTRVLTIINLSLVGMLFGAFVASEYLSIALFNDYLFSTQLIAVCVMLLVTRKQQENDDKNTNSDGDEERNSYLVSPYRDTVTNLPSLAQAIAIIEDKLQEVQTSDFAFLAFKPLNFSQVNRVIGHQNSDLMLLQFAYKLAKFTRDNQLLVNFGVPSSPERVCRLNGLDFLVVIDKRQCQHPIKIVLESVAKELTEVAPKAMSFRNFSLNYELTFGANLPSSNFSANLMIAQTSDALLLAERSASPLAYYNHESEIFSEYQLSNMEKVRSALEEGRASCLYQPQVSASTRKVKGFEVIFDPSSVLNEQLESKQFMRLVENTGVIYMITQLSIGAALDLLAVLAKNNQENLKVSINLSSQDLLQPELADFIEEQAQKRSVLLEHLVIEISEGILLSGAFRARMMIDQLRALGIQIAVDDFSGSYEALKYLRKASIAQVKIDCLHLGEQDRYAADKTIVMALVNVIRKMEIPVIATEINRQSTQKAILEVGGDTVQGKIVHSGLALNQLESWLVNWQKAS